jgi:chromosome segregation ATPase
METNNTNLLHETNRQLTIAFLIAYLIGVGLVGLSPFAPCIPLLGYATLGFFLTRDQRNSERFADSLYYLGFLLTLTALLLALWHLSKQGSVLEIANALGAGLSASILGLGLRVLVVQFRGTVSDQEEETRQSIEEQAAKVRQALQALEQGWTQATGVLSSLRTDMEEFRTSMNRIQADTLKTAQQRQAQLLESSARAAEVWDQEIQKLRQTFARIDIPPTLVREAFARVAEDLGKTAAQVIAGAASVMEGVTAKFAAISEKSDKSGAALEKLAASVATAVAASDEIKKTADSISATVRTAGETIGTALTNGATNLAKSATAIDQHVNGAGKSIGGFTQSIQGAVHALSTMMATMRKLEKSVNDAATAVAAIQGDIKTSTAGLLTEVQQVGADVRQVRQATGELVELATTQLASP